MAFVQFKLELENNQSRGIFDSYIYESDTDTIADIQVAGYFDRSRYKDDPDWFGSFLKAKMSDGLATGFIQEDGSLDPASPASETVIVETSGPTYNMTGTEDIIFCTGNVTINAISIASAVKDFTVDAQGGNVTMNPDGSDTFQIGVVADASAARFAPKASNSQWRSI